MFLHLIALFSCCFHGNVVGAARVTATSFQTFASDKSPPLDSLVEAFLQRESGLGDAVDYTIDNADWYKDRLTDSQGSSFVKEESLDTGNVTSTSYPGTFVLEDPAFNFEGLSHEVNTIPLRRRQHSPPDPVGDVGKYHYVQAVKFAFAVYSKQDGTLESGPYPLGSLWEGFNVEGCNARNSDPIVLYDQFVGRWFFSQLTLGCLFPGEACFTCVAISESEDPAGPYYRYAFVAQEDSLNPGTTVVPDFPKWGIWDEHYILTTRDFGGFTSGNVAFVGQSIYAVEKAPMLIGNKNTRVQRYILSAEVFPLYLFGDNLLPPDVDGSIPPPTGRPAPIVGTVDKELFNSLDSPAPFDALNIWELTVDWSRNTGSVDYAAMIPVKDFSSSFECGGQRGCIPQPGVDTNAYLSSLSTFVQHRFAYRNKGSYETMTTCQSIPVADTGGAFGTYGTRWYEIRRTTSGGYSVYQQGTFAPSDGINRWMGSIAQDGAGNMAMGYSVSDHVSTFPGLRMTGRLAGDKLDFMTLGEATIADGSGVQGVNGGQRWGDYSSMNVDSDDDCTFWYTGMYYTEEGENFCEADGETSCWQTRIVSFQLPGCSKKIKRKKEKRNGKKD